MRNFSNRILFILALRACLSNAFYINNEQSTYFDDIVNAMLYLGGQILLAKNQMARDEFNIKFI